MRGERGGRVHEWRTSRQKAAHAMSSTRNCGRRDTTWVMASSDINREGEEEEEDSPATPAAEAAVDLSLLLMVILLLMLLLLLL